jgi:hypothetical protein
MKSIKKYQTGGLNPGAGVYRYQGGTQPTYNPSTGSFQSSQSSGIGSSSMYGDLSKAQQASMISQGVGGFGDIGVGAYNIYAGIKGRKEASKELDRLRATAPSLATPSQFYEAQKSAYDQRLIELQKEALGRNVAASLGAAGQLGGRALIGSVGAVTTGAARSMQELALDAARERRAATTELGRARQVETEMKEARSGRDIGFQMDKYAQSTAAIGQGIGQAVGGTANVALMAMGLPPVAKNGAKIEKTPGEFSHKNNPIDIVKDGAKIGEMTGGEYIFNPKQMSNIEKFVAKGDKEKLHSYVKGLIKQFNKK